MTDRDQEKRDAMRWLVLTYGGPALRWLAAALDEPDDPTTVGAPVPQSAGGVASESQPV